MRILVNLQHEGLIRVSGTDAQTFLQGQLTCDVRDLNDSELSLGAYCNLKGRVIVLFKLFSHESGYYLQCPMALVDKALAKLKQHAMFSKVLLEDVSTAYAKIGMVGERVDIKTADVMVLAIPAGTGASGSSDAGIHERWEIIAPAALTDPLWDTLSHKGTTGEKAVIKTPAYWTLLNIRSGIPDITAETSEQFLPHYINLPALKAVSFSKGCYHGQEIIARMQYKATIRKHMVYVLGELSHENETVVMSEVNDEGVRERLVIRDMDPIAGN